MANTDHLWLGLDFDPNSEEPINFIETRFQDLSPFSAHEVEVDGEVFKTVEHAYHALRLKPGPEREVVKNARSPKDAWREGQKYKNNPDLLIDGYDKYKIMEKLCREKLAQHKDVREVLKVTGNRDLLKVFDEDYYWGTGADFSGQNNLGKIWMDIRAELV